MTTEATEYTPQDAFGLVRSFTRHVAYVKLALLSVGQALERRATVHDLSKLLDDEFAGFARINKHARVHKFGSPEYADGMRQEKDVIDLHFSRNSHHPERPSIISRSSVQSDDLLYEVEAAKAAMTFLDIIEMVCDWWGAGKGYDSKMSWEDSVALNLKQKGKYLTPAQLWLAQDVAMFLGKELV